MTLLAEPVSRDRTLREGQWQIEDLVFGTGTIFPLATFPDISYGGVDDQDKERPRGAGIVFGRDRYKANIITFEGAVWSEYLDDDLQWLAKWWRGNSARSTPNQSMVLKYCFEGKQRQVYGRPRQFSPIPTPAPREWINFQCDFQCIDDKFYSQEEFHAHAGINPSSLGGLYSPLVAPLQTVGTSSSTAGEFESGGSTEAWLRAVIQGPIDKPSFELIDEVEGWRQNMPRTSLNFDQKAIIQSMPWDRKVVDERGVSLGGAFDQQSRKLSELWLPPGRHELVLRGTDMTGTSYIDLFWHEAFLSI